nr:hypothetical protein [Candidatus Freyarchaeota archaeon]
MSGKPLGLIIISVFLFSMSFITILGGYLSYLMPMLNWQEINLQTGFLILVYSPDILVSWVFSYLIQLLSGTQTLVTIIILFALGVSLFVSGVGFYKQKKWAFIFTVCYAGFNIILPFTPPSLNLNLLYFLSSLTSNIILIQISRFIPAIIGFALLIYLPGDILKRFEQNQSKNKQLVPNKNNEEDISKS